MLKIALNHRDHGMLELFGGGESKINCLWGVFHVNALWDEEGGLHDELVEAGEAEMGEVEVVIISREKYDRLKGEKGHAEDS